ncbi:uncharacterized protein LOC121386720 [Gigantopelta aegis]|uniref:uncharacterized protein LOC121386720 n=1 Tax=Gigantopelta aegis TaxID=1735272 RepID=UPI001B8877D3|nr:uncharacterized protein LOC121386720 [Gigantopelta aegis]
MASDDDHEDYSLDDVARLAAEEQRSRPQMDLNPFDKRSKTVVGLNMAQPLLPVVNRNRPVQMQHHPQMQLQQQPPQAQPIHEGQGQRQAERHQRRTAPCPPKEGYAWENTNGNDDVMLA